MLEFKDHKLKEYLGDIDYYLEERNVENLREVEKKTAVASEKKEVNLNRNFHMKNKRK